MKLKVISLKIFQLYTSKKRNKSCIAGLKWQGNKQPLIKVDS